MCGAEPSKSRSESRSDRVACRRRIWRIAFAKKSSPRSISTMKKTWIGIPTRYHEKSEYIGQIRHYLDAVLWAGGLPLLIPSTTDPEVTREYVEQVQGVLLPGSPNDIDPRKYGEEPHPKLGKLQPEREATDFSILDLAEKKKMPVLGMCFGIQSINVHHGSSLVQAITSVVSSQLVPDRDDRTPPTPHAVRCH